MPSGFLSLKAVLLASAAILAGDMPVSRDTFVIQILGTTAALADDDDDDDGGGWGERGGGGDDRDDRRSWRGRDSGAIWRRILPRWATPRPARRAPAPAPATPVRAPDEIVGLGFAPAELDQLVAQGFVVLEQSSAFDTQLVKLGVPSGLTLDAAREQVAAVASQAVIDFNHYFRPEQASGRLVRTMVGWPAAQDSSGSCPADVHIGLIDTAINPDHAAFDAGRVEVIRLVDAELPESGRQHGTAVAALLVGAAGSRTPGLVPGGGLIAVDAFHRAARQDDRSDSYTLVRALDLLAARAVHVVNLSLAGPPNLLLEQAVANMAERDIVMIAAAGNGGPNSSPVYPAAYEEVVAVTAIDRRRRPYRRAGRGEHIDLAAPGVEVWTAASVSGARPKTGTSFAAPFVTAAAAVMKAANPQLSSDEIRNALAIGAEDLGEPGKDPVFGWGLLNARAICEADRPQRTVQP